VDGPGECTEGLHIVQGLLFRLVPGLQTAYRAQVQGTDHGEELGLSRVVPLPALLALPVAPEADQGVVLLRDVDVVAVREDLLSEGAIIPVVRELHGHNGH